MSTEFWFSPGVPLLLDVFDRESAIATAAFLNFLVRFWRADTTLFAGGFCLEPKIVEAEFGRACLASLTYC